MSDEGDRHGVLGPSIDRLSDEEFSPGPDVATVRLHMPCVACGKVILTLMNRCDACSGVSTRVSLGRADWNLFPQHGDAPSPLAEIVALDEIS